MSVLEATQAILGMAATAQPVTPKKGRSAGGAVPGGGGYTDGPALMTLVNRMTMGFTQEEMGLATQMGSTNYLEYHLDHLNIKDAQIDGYLGNSGEDILGQEPFETLWMTPYLLGQQASATTIQNALVRATIIRGVYSKRQLFERMVEFWSDHFNIYVAQEDVTQRLKTVDDRNVIRANALTTFPNLLRASAKSPCMLAYLDNNLNTRFGGNENYAREIMELHTLGVTGGYTQTDVQRVAKCLTGWTYFGANGSGTGAPFNGYTFNFNANNHDPAAQILFEGTPQQITIPAGIANSAANISRGELVLTALLNHPSTAKFISKKMLTRFWGEDPPQALIDQVAQTYTLTSGDVKAMLRTIFGFFPVFPPPLKFKRPYHVLISALRSVKIKVTSMVNFPNSVQTPLVAAGHHPFFWQAPDGYPDTIAYWVGLLLPRWNFGASLMQGSYSGITVDTTNAGPLLAGASTAQQVADRIDYVIFNNTMAATDKAQILAFLQPVVPATVPSQTQIKEAFGLAIGSPGFQWH